MDMEKEDRSLDKREIVIQLKVYELRMMMEALKGHPWKYAHPILMSCDAQLQRFENAEKEREHRRIKGIQEQKTSEIKALAMKKADDMFNIKVTEFEEKEKKKKNRRKSRR